MIEKLKSKKVILFAVLFIVLFALSIFLAITINDDIEITLTIGDETEIIELKKGEKLKVPEDPSSGDFIFVGWYHEGELFDFNEPITENIELVAKFEEDNGPLSVTFKYNNGAEDIVVEVQKNSVVTEPEIPTKENSKFDGWNLGTGTFGFTTQITQSIILEAKWLEYYCEEGYSLDGETCYKTETTTGSYECSEGHDLDGDQCYHSYEQMTCANPEASIVDNTCHIGSESEPAVCPEGYYQNEAMGCSIEYKATYTCPDSFSSYNNTCSKQLTKEAMTR